jgi:uncharacterized membrane protein HdeD (DUF308 family)
MPKISTDIPYQIIVSGGVATIVAAISMASNASSFLCAIWFVGSYLLTYGIAKGMSW